MGKISWHEWNNRHSCKLIKATKKKKTQNNLKEKRGENEMRRIK